MFKCFGCFDGLVNNVGIVSVYGMLLDVMMFIEWQCWLFSLYGVFLCSKYVLFVLCVLLMDMQIGVIINIVFICVWQFEVDSEVYVVVKGGLVVFIYVLVISEGLQVCVNSISFGWIIIEVWQVLV